MTVVVGVVKPVEAETEPKNEEVKAEEVKEIKTTKGSKKN